jgi:hypothetical protein
MMSLLAAMLLSTSAAHADETVVSETIEVGPNDAFHWPYFLYVPAEAAEAMNAGHPPALLVVPNNTSELSDDEQVHERAARSMAGGNNRWLSEQLGAPLLVPAFPRLASAPNLYTHALDRDAMLVTDARLRRLDLQLLAMIEDARARLRKRHIEVRSRILMNGHSASGMFVTRFVLLHPEHVLAAAVGSPGGWPTVPTAEYRGHRLRFPIGVADLEELAGPPFDPVAFRRVQLFFLLGARDTNDSVTSTDSYDEVDAALATRLFGNTPVKRWPFAERLYKAAGSACEFRLYPGVGHRPSEQMKDEILVFFRRVLAG